MSLQDIVVLLGWVVVFAGGSILYQHRATVGAFIMSRWGSMPSPDQAVAPSVDQQVQQPDQLIATSNNAINHELNDTTLLPEEAREIIRFQAKVEALADLIKTGQVSNMAKGIEIVLHCSRSGKEDSTYQRARRTLDPLVKATPQYRPLTPEQQAAREALGLPEKV